MKGDVLLRHPERHGCTNPPWVTSLLKNPKCPPYRILPAEFTETQTSVREGGLATATCDPVRSFMVDAASVGYWIANRSSSRGKRLDC